MSDLDAVTKEATTYVQKLTAVRDHLAKQLTDAPASAAASIAKQLMDVLARLEDLAPTRRESAVDELAQARESRRTNAGL